MNGISRIDDFCGTTEEYIRYLECEVFHCRQQQSQQQSKPQRWKLELDSFLSNIPVSSQWQEKREEMQLVSVESNIAALKILLGSSSTPPSDEIAGNLVERAKLYARCTNAFLQEEGFATCVAHFREIVFISWCVVLIYNGFSKDVVDSTMQECISKTKKKNLHRLRTGITWVNRSMARLSENEWGHRSTEIFLLCGSSIAQYGRFGEACEDTLDRLTNHLTEPEYTNPCAETTGWIPFSIPCIIKHLAGNTLSLQQICDPFEYSRRSDYTTLLEKYQSIAQHAGVSESLPILTPTSSMTSIDQRLWSVPSIGTSITNSNESSSDLESSSEGTDRFSTTQFNGQTELPTQEYARGETVDLLGSRLLDISTFSTGIAIESAFNQNTTLWFVRPYGSPIFTCAQEGDVAGMTRLLWNGDASVFDVDPYGLGLLYYTSYYCWRSFGSAAAIQASRRLIEMGADADWVDEIGNTPLATMIDGLLVSRAMNGDSDSSLNDIAILFSKCPRELWQDYICGRNFTRLHEVLLKIGHERATLEGYLFSLLEAGALADVIDMVDSCGRTALAWAVEYGWADAVATLLYFGANPHERLSLRGKLPLLHLAIAGPASNTGFLDVVRILLRAGVDINAKDHEGWSPLHIAASWNLIEIVEELARFGRLTLDWIATTDDGKSAFDLSANDEYNDRILTQLRVDTLNGGNGLLQM